MHIPYQRYLLHELADDINSGQNVRSPVFIETRAMYCPDGPQEMRPVGEVEFVQGLAAARGRPQTTERCFLSKFNSQSSVGLRPAYPRHCKKPTLRRTYCDGYVGTISNRKIGLAYVILSLR